MRLNYPIVHNLFILLAILFTSFGFEGVAHGNAVMGNTSSCTKPALILEKKYGIPAFLLHAIAKAESGRPNSKGQLVAWPWTINVEGKSYYYPTKQHAIQAVKQFQAQGKKSIDVGCMQVNLYYHPNAFASLEHAFNPATNIEYAARFLVSLIRTHVSLQKAVAYYHSTTPMHHVPYSKRVFRIWAQQRGANWYPHFAQASQQRTTSPRLLRLRRLAQKYKATYVASNGAIRHPVQRVGRIRRVAFRGDTPHLKRMSTIRRATVVRPR